MRTFWHSVRVAGLATMLFGLAALFASGQSRAVPVELLPSGFDPSSGTPTTVATVTGTGGTLIFTLDLDDPLLTKIIFGSFSVDYFHPSATTSLGLSGDTATDGPFNPLGPIPVGAVTGSVLANVTTWSLTVGALDLPLDIVVTSILFAFFEDPFTPSLKMELIGDLAIASAVPLPAALPLFASGLGALGLLAWRRKRRASLPA
jgi:hypothetical protein